LADPGLQTPCRNSTQHQFAEIGSLFSVALALGAELPGLQPRQRRDGRQVEVSGYDDASKSFTGNLAVAF
jgi:hypothetical protein